MKKIISALVIGVSIFTGFQSAAHAQRITEREEVIMYSCFFLSSVVANPLMVEYLKTGDFEEKLNEIKPAIAEKSKLTQDIFKYYGSGRAFFPNPSRHKRTENMNESVIMHKSVIFLYETYKKCFNDLLKHEFSGF